VTDDFRFSSRTVAIVSSAVTVATLTTLVVTTGVRDADGLSTVALSLAIVSFAAQLLVFIVQTHSANEQELRSQRLYANMLGLLAQVGERTKGTHHAITMMQTEMLQHLLGKARSEADAAGLRPDEPQYDEHLAESLARLWPDAPESAPSREDERVIRDLSTFSEDPSVVSDAVESLSALPDEDLALLAELGRDERISRALGTPPGLPSVGDPKQLFQSGLIRPFALGKTHLWQLSPRGRELARVLLADGPPPEGLKVPVEAVRGRIVDEL
jgi:hypothetical protein